MQGNTLTEFIHYFRQLAAEHVELQGFLHGPGSRIVSGSRSKLKYPLLWLETPALVLQEKDGTDPEGRRECALAVLHNVASGDDAAEDAIWAATERVMLDIVARMRKDRKTRLFAFDGNVRLDAVATISVANERGWRIEFDISKAAGLCYDASRWEAVVP